MTTKPKQNIAQTLLSRAHSPTTASTLYTTKVQTRPLYLKPTSPDPPSNQQIRRHARLTSLSSRKKRKPAPLSSRQKRSLLIYEIPKSHQKYAIYAPLHKMWTKYIQEVLGGEKSLPIRGPAAAKLCSADYHGALMEVVRSRCVSRVGIKGIVVKDTKFVFEIVTERDVIKVVPKEHTVFRFRIPQPQDVAVEEEQTVEGGKREVERSKDLVFELHGDQFIVRASDRANKKFKSHFLPDL